ncbi:NitT/TauT family transport system ATP-binding protein [Halogranum amylolyticum]|uniref:NitT/TauT family transport system ATP-binding protein n=1 Tax=Halogranum amylolyticum TaxID=660520 RepID=A0A1H8TIQ8_9EURY|nr:ABC transporter ATP-binding protein [Halogranum amylolyticum]SEO90676.1 NitT/TauT family transport system ATP-binding protein [Halogranum amylolyticum]
MISSEGLTVEFDDLTALRDLSLEVDDGGFVTVIGPSGCGKTTLLRTLGGLEEPTEGSVSVGGASPAAARRDGRVGFVFQDHALLPWKTALENVTFLRRMAGKPADETGAREVLATVGLEKFVDARPATLSGGMKQRVAIARAIHLGADVLLMDEPFGELDELTREEMSVEICRIWRNYRKTVVFVTHSIPEAVLLGDRCLGLHGPPAEIAWERSIDLPRPRDRGVFESAAFQEQVAAVRRLFHGER